MGDSAMVAVALFIGLLAGWKIQVWVYSNKIKKGELVFKHRGEWIGSMMAKEELWKNYNAECMRRGKYE